MSDSYLYKPYKSKYVSVYNALSPLLGVLGKDPKKKINFESLHEIASKATGLSDFGSDDYHEALNTLIESILEEKHFHSFGYFLAKGMIVEPLKNRLYLEEAYKRSPEIRDERIDGAIWVLGLPRTGSTLLHNLLALDEENRTLKRWEAAVPSPMDIDPKVDLEQRKKKAQVTDKILHVLAPDLLKKHVMGWDLPEECVMLFRDTFRSQLFGFSLGVEKYGEWLRNQNLSTAYSYYLRQLKVLQYQEKKTRWVFKAPFHSLHVDAIEAVFNQPRYINLHRNPNSVLPSVASLGETLQGMCSKYVDRRLAGRHVLKECKLAIDNVERSREKIQNDRIIDVYFSDFIKDPSGTIERVYEKWELPFTETYRAKIKVFMANNPKNKHGEHTYAREEYGLTDALINEKFGAYIASIS